MKERLFLIIFLIFFIFPIPTQAVDFVFNPNNIITDYELKDKNSMSLEAIQAFLESYESILANKNLQFNGKTAAEIIYQAAQAYNISPKFILTKLDHEQCLIRYCSFLDDSGKRQNALDWATGFSVYNHSSNPDFKGFDKQVDALASVQNDYIRKAGIKSFIYSRGQTFTTRDGYTITPENQATANLYTYTPYRGGDSKIGGNYFFAKLWYKYFDSKYYPDGTVLKDKDGNFWLIENYRRRPYVSRNIYLSNYSEDEAVTADDVVLNSYSIGEPIKFSNYSLVKIEDSSIYLINGKEKRKFKDAETFRVLGFNPEEVVIATSQELKNYSLGYPIGAKAVYPQGQLVQNKKNGAVFWLANNFLSPIIDKIILEINYKDQKPLLLSNEELSQYKTHEPIKLKNAVFIKSQDNQIYVISQGNKLPIRSEEDFKILYGQSKLAKIYQAPDVVLALHPSGGQIAAVRQIERAKPQIAGIQINPPTEKFLAIWDKSKISNEMIIGESYTVEIIFKNRGTEVWNKNNVFLEILGQDNKPIDFLQLVAESGDTFPRLSDNEQIAQNQNGSFQFSLSPKIVGDFAVRFKLKNNQNEYIKGAVYQAKIKVKANNKEKSQSNISAEVPQIEITAKSDYQAVIINHNFPPAVLNKWNKINLEIIVKNSGEKSWHRRQTVLKVYAKNLNKNLFYDIDDWIDKETAAIALLPSSPNNFADTEIKKGESALFRFTFNIKGLKRGLYHYRIFLYEKSQNQEIVLDSEKYYEEVMRVD